MAAQLVQLESAPDLAERVYRSLLDAICDGSLAPGQRITQEDIAHQLAVSRQPVLQALRLLKKDGLVQDAPGRGLVVAPLDVASPKPKNWTVCNNWGYDDPSYAQQISVEPA